MKSVKSQILQLGASITV